MEIADVRRRIHGGMAAARERARQRRERSEDAERGYEAFLQKVAGPVARQVATVLKAEGFAFTLSTPGRALRLSSDHRRDDFVEISLQSETDPPRVVGHIRRTRGSRTLDEEVPLKPDTPPGDLREEDVLEFLVRALEPWLER